MDTLLHIGLTNALLATGLAVVVAGVSYCCRRPALIHSLWLLVLLKLLTPPLFSLPVAWPAGWDLGTGENKTQSDSTKPASGGVHPRWDKPGGSHAATRSEKLPPQAEAKSLLPNESKPEAEPAGDLPRSWVPHSHPESTVPEPAAPAPRSRSPVPTPGNPPWQEAVCTLWLAGCLGWWALAGYRIVRFRRWSRHATPAPVALQAEVQELAKRLGLARCPAVGFVTAPISPLLWALGGMARLLLPSGLWERLTPEQRQTLLVHELAHLRRRDHWVRLLELVVLGLYWWHPVVWWARRELREAEEQCCDAWVVWALPGAAPAYATALVETVAFLSQARTTLPLAASGIGHAHTLKRRLTMILRGTPPRALSGAGFLAVLALGALLLPLLPTRAEDPSRQETAEQPAAKKADKQTIPETNRGRESTAEQPVQPKATPRKTKTLPAATPKRGSKPAKDGDKLSHAEQVESARDEVELLEAQLLGKRAEVKEAMVRLKQAHVEWKRLKDLGAKAGASAQEVDAAQSQVEVRQAQLEGKEAQLREAELRLKQAQRRLARLRKRQIDKSSRPKGKDERSSGPRDTWLPAADPVKWGRDFNTARREAQDKKRPLVILFGVDHCLWSKRVNARTFCDPTVAQLMNKQFITLRIDDDDKHVALAEMLHIQYYPTIIIAAPNGKIISTREGYIEPAPFLKQLQDALKAIAEPNGCLECTQPVKDFGTVKRGTMLEHSFVFTNTAKGPIHLGDVRTTCAWCTAVLRQAEVPPGKKTMIVVRIDTRRFEGPKTVAIYFPFTGAQEGIVKLGVHADSSDNADEKNNPMRRPGKRPSDQKKLRELEKKLDALFKDAEALRRELRR